jgi:hypothetical protein
VINLQTMFPIHRPSRPPYNTLRTDVPCSDETCRQGPGGSVDTMRVFARAIYDELRIYHGTAKGSKAGIREHGFQRRLKVAGATANSLVGREYALVEPTFTASRAEGFEAAAATHHYFSRDKKSALHFAKLVAPDAPALVRVIGTESQLGLHLDPDSCDSDHYRTGLDIPAGQVLGSRRKGNPGSPVELFRTRLAARTAAPVSHGNAAYWLHDAQSDSESDI